MIRRAVATILASAGLLAPWWMAAPAGAGSGVGCTGSTCSVLLSSLITLKGDVGTAAAHAPLPVAPPPCLWQPIGGTTEIRASALQFVRKLSGFNKPSQANEEAFERALDAVSAASAQLLSDLRTAAPPKDREVEAAKARARSAQRYAA